MMFNEKYYSGRGVGTETHLLQSLLRDELKYDDVKKLKKLKGYLRHMVILGEIPEVLTGSRKLGSSHVRLIIMSYPRFVITPTRQRNFLLTEDLYELIREYGVGVLDILIDLSNCGRSPGELIERFHLELAAGSTWEWIQLTAEGFKELSNKTPRRKL